MSFARAGQKRGENLSRDVTTERARLRLGSLSSAIPPTPLWTDSKFSGQTDIFWTDQARLGLAPSGVGWTDRSATGRTRSLHTSFGSRCALQSWSDDDVDILAKHVQTLEEPIERIAIGATAEQGGDFGLIEAEE